MKAEQAQHGAYNFHLAMGITFEEMLEYYGVIRKVRPAAPTVPPSQLVEAEGKCEKCGAHGATLINCQGATVCHMCIGAGDAAPPPHPAPQEER